jgi:3-methyladenine DNA glycosylase AlkD
VDTSRAPATPDPPEVAADLERRLRERGDAERAVKERAYLESELTHLGVSVPAIRAATREIHRELATTAPAGRVPREQLLGLVVELWDEPAGAPIHERRMAAVELLELEQGQLGVDDVALLERLLRECRTWALLDGLAVSVVGELVDREPAALDPSLRRWAGDDDPWMRRASLLTHLPGLCRGTGDLTRFGELADGMLEEPGFFVRKAIGWVLREAGRRDPGAVVAWLEPRVRRAAGLTVREAVRYLPEPDRERLLAARRGS